MEKPTQHTAAYFNCQLILYCTDTDECASNSANNCSSNALCINTMGSYNCSCKNGFSGDGYTCSDDHECNLRTHNCSVNADCTNTVGGFTCTCKPGYLGNGTSCDGKETSSRMVSNSSTGMR